MRAAKVHERIENYSIPILTAKIRDSTCQIDRQIVPKVMPFPLMLALAMIQGQEATPPVQVTPIQAAPIQQEVTSFTTPYEILEANRIALTPSIDGTIAEDEWDELGDAGKGKAYLQWEPNELHIAGRVVEGHDLLLSVDFRNNGWLIGSDNVEFRLSTTETGAIITTRLLDATKVTGPTWVNLDGFQKTTEIKSETVDGMTTYEATIKDTGMGLLPVETEATMSVRVDAPPTTEAAFQPFLPRVMTPVKLMMQRSAAMPTGLRFNTEGLGKSVAPGDYMRLRVTFNGTNNMNLTKIAMRSEGLASEGTTKIEIPFPKFDTKGRAFVDYQTTLADNVPLGYKTLRTQISSADGISSLIQSSYRVAPPVDFDLVRLQLPVAANDRSQKYSFYARSNGGKRMVGHVDVVVPAPLRVINANGWDLALSANQRNRYTFELLVPADVVGTFPITFKGKLNGLPVEQTDYMTVGTL
ncbi:hypothetical protein BH11ARM1_BH11ARM1_16330 [soil metagenome]